MMPPPPDFEYELVLRKWCNRMEFRCFVYDGKLGESPSSFSG
jgi:hypothetical protein